jgi:hypothetical protein
MVARRTTRTHRQEAGIALLISIFVLLLISVVAIALVVSSGTESALAGNYRSATGVYYAALSGLEEARGRLLSKNSDAFTTTNASGFLPATGTALAMGATYYLINPVGGELITPWDSSSTYADNQFVVEFGPSGFAAPTNPSPTALSVWNRNPLLALNLPGPLYKWVRINAVSEKSAGIDADNDNLADSTTALYYDGAHFSNNPSAGPQVLELTSFAILPNGSQKLVQYLVAPEAVTLPPFPAAITLLGNNVDYSGPSMNGWLVNGNDTIDLGSCTHGSSVWAIGYSNNSDASKNSITGSGAVATSPYKNNYTGQGGTIPNVGYIGASIPPTLQKPSQVDALVQSITQYADSVIPGPATGSNLPSGMSSSNLKTVVVNGDLDLTGWHNQGYGLLVVTGNLTFDPDASWYGIVLLIGQGYMTGSHAGSGQIVGGLFLAKTRNTSGSLFPDPNLPNSNGTPGTYGTNIQFANNMGGQGIFYSSCWILAAQLSGSYKILSFHEISQ